MPSSPISSNLRILTAIIDTCDVFAEEILQAALPNARIRIQCARPPPPEPVLLFCIFNSYYEYENGESQSLEILSRVYVVLILNMRMRTAKA